MHEYWCYEPNLPDSKRVPGVADTEKTLVLGRA